MAISRAQLLKELLPGLNALFGLEYNSYDNEHTEIYEVESSDRAFEEEVMLSGFGEAPVKSEGSGVAYDQAQEVYTARYTNETVALAFSLTEEAIEDNLYDKLSARYTKALARSMANAKQVKGANVLNNAFSSSYVGGDGKELCATDHPTVANVDLRNELSTSADLNETSLEQALIDIADFRDERNLKVNAQARKLIIPPALQFVADRLSVQLGYDKIYNVLNPFSWMEMISLETKTNFFEKRVSDYRKAGVGAEAETNANTFSFESDF